MCANPAIVSLLVRLWVEINILVLCTDWISSASSWGCELKSWKNHADEGTGRRSASSWGCELKCTWVRIPVWGQASCEVAYSTRYNKDSPTSIGGEMNCKQENERQWWAERNRYPPLTWGKSQSACCWHVRLCELPTVSWNKSCCSGNKATGTVPCRRITRNTDCYERNHRADSVRWFLHVWGMLQGT